MECTLPRMACTVAVFSGAKAFNGDLSRWNVASVRAMSSMFKMAAAFEGGDLSQWDTGAVTNMAEMFYGASTYVGDGLAAWDVSKVTSMR